MEMTKQRKMLIATAVVGLGAVALDRLVLGPPDTAAASQGASAAPAPTPTAPGTAPDGFTPAPAAANPAQPTRSTGNALPSFESLTERLIQVAESTPSAEAPADPFSLPEGWGVAVDTTTPEPIAGKPVQSSKFLLEQYKLDGTFRSTNESDQVVMLALISGGDYTRTAMQVGAEVKVKLPNASSDTAQPFAVYRLVEIGNRAVVWAAKDDPDRRVVMRVEKVL